MNNSPTLPPPGKTDWLARLYRIADDVDLGLPSHATANAIRDVIADIYSARHRATALADIAGGKVQ